MNDVPLTAFLYEVQRDMNVPKKHYNSFGKYHYRKCEDIVDEAKRHLPNNIALIISDEVVLVGDRHYIKATASLKRGNAELSATGWAREATEQRGMGEAQITGSASSYARKYALCGLFAIDDGVDDDSTSEKPEVKAAPVPTPLPELVERLKRAVDNLNTLDEFKLWQAKPPVEQARSRVFSENIGMAEDLENYIEKKAESLQ